MGVPKNFSKSVNINLASSNHERRLELWKEGWEASGTFVPKGVLYEDMDRDFIKLIEEDLSFSVGGEKVPTFFLTMQRWAEFARTWKFTDKDRNVQMPFVTIVRNPDIQFGTNPVTQYTIPQKQRFDYMKVPNYDGDTVGYDIYKIPQPIAVNLTYQVRFFSYRMREINKFNKIIMQAFQSRQKHIKCNGHFFPVVLETIGDESTIDQFEQKRFYVQNFEMQLLGYIMDEEEYEVSPAIKRVVTVFETQPDILPGLNQTDNLNPGEGVEEVDIVLVVDSEAIGSGGPPPPADLIFVTVQTTIQDSIFITDYTLINSRDCKQVNTDCLSISPKFFLDTGSGFTVVSLPLQVLPGYKMYAYLELIDQTIEGSVTLRGYKNKL